MHEIIKILKEILYPTDVGENDRYATALIEKLHKLEDIEENEEF